MDTIDGIDIYPVISLIIFFSFFLILTILVYSSSKKHIEYMEGLPLDTEPGEKTQTNEK